MADALVNSTHTGNLTGKVGSEPTHLPAASGSEIGGTGTTDHPHTVTIDGATGVSTDTSIPHAVAGQPSDLAAATTTTPDIKFDDEADKDITTDHLDEALDAFMSVGVVGVTLVNEDEEIVIKTGGDKKDDDKDDKKDGDKPNPFAKKDDDKDPKAGEKSNPFAKNDGDDKGEKQVVKEGELPPWLKKDGDKKGELDPAKKNGPAIEGQPSEKKDGDDDKPKKLVGLFAKKDESFQLRIARPAANLFESVGIAADQQKQVGFIFETVIKDVAKSISEQLSKQYQTILESRIASYQDVMAKQVDAYLNYVAEEWCGENRVAIRTSLRTQMAEEFMTGLKTLFTEHYIDVPESKIDVVTALTEQVETLKTAGNTMQQKMMQLRTLAESANKGRHVAEFVRKHKLTEVSAAKLEKLAESIKYASAKDFKEKLSMLKESYFAETKSDLKHLPEAVVAEVKTATRTTSGDADVDLIAETISRQAKSELW